MPNRRISQLPNVGILNSDSVIPLSQNGVTYSIPVSGLTSYLNTSIDVLGQFLSGYTSGTTQSIDSGDTVLGAFEKLQAQIDNKSNSISVSGKSGMVLYTDGVDEFWNTRMAVRNSADTAEISYIEIDQSNGNINLVTTADSSTINIINNEDSVTITEGGVVLQNIVSGKTAGIDMDFGVKILFDTDGFNTDDDGVYITNPERIYFRKSYNTSGETVALLSDLTGEKTFSINLGIGDYTISNSGIYDIVSGGGGSNSIYFPNPADFNGQSITLIDSDISISPNIGVNAYTPIVNGLPLGQILSNQMYIFKSINSLWRGGLLS
jgi:hypothetical protein